MLVASTGIRTGKGLAQRRGDNQSMREGRLGSMLFFFLSARRVTLLYQTGFLHIKRIKTFACKTCNREGIRKKFKILKKNNIEALVISIEKTTQVALVDDRTVFIIIWRSKRVFNVFRRKLSLGAPVNYRLTLPLLSLPAQLLFSFTLGHLPFFECAHWYRS